MKRISSSILCLILALFSFPTTAQIELFTQLRDLIQKQKYAEAKKMIDTQTRSAIPKEDLHLFDFQSAYLDYQLGLYPASQTKFQNYLATHSKLKDYAQYYLGMVLVKLNKDDEAVKAFQSIQSMEINSKLASQVSKELGEIHLRKKKYSDAKVAFTKAMRIVRVSDEAANLLYLMAQVERGQGSEAGFCKVILKLYSEFPHYSLISNWDGNLKENKFQDSKTNCYADYDVFRQRVRYLMWNGFDKKALAEIQKIKTQNVYQPVEIDQSLAYYYVQEGEVAKARDILMKYEGELKDQFGYILNYAGILSRAGELDKAIQYFYKAHLLRPKDQSGRNALYQAAFLSYQGRNYDMAGKRFQEFLQKYPSSGLTQDAKWHLAWIKYLQKDYLKAIADFKNLESVKVKTRGRNRARRIVIQQDRNKYWLAMSYMKLRKYDEAKSLFDSLARDPLFGYYAMASQARLVQIKKSKALSQRNLAFTPVRISRFDMNDYILPTENRNPEQLSEETEDQVQLPLDMNFKQSIQDGSGDSIVIGEEHEADVDVAEAEEEDANGKANQKALTKFEKTRDLMILGLNDWARWDLFEIEKITRDRQSLRILVNEYAALKQYHRSAYLAHTYFSDARKKLGPEIGRELWIAAYPRAYEEQVLKYSKQYAVMDELIWGIMRAESQFKVDAISPVGALGLMQVMPFTGMRLSALMKESKFDASDLLKAESSIKYGTRYLRRLSDKFHGLSPLVAAGYNAGPHRVKSWVYSFGDLDTDEFIEHIPFLETRNYVKRVLSYQFIYSRLYKGKPEFMEYLAKKVPYAASDKPPFREDWDEI